MKLKTMIVATIGVAGVFGAMIVTAAPRPKDSVAALAQKGVETENAQHEQAMLAEGKKTFRYETFGSEAFWGDALQLHKDIAGEQNGGRGPGVQATEAC